MFIYEKKLQYPVKINYQYHLTSFRIPPVCLFTFSIIKYSEAKTDPRYQ